MAAALVTGASERIGAAAASFLASRNYTVIVHYHTGKAAAESLCAGIRDSGGTAYPLEADLTDPQQLAALIDKAEALANSPLSLLINNAAVFMPQPWEDMAMDNWEHHLSLNLIAPVFLARAFWERVRSAPRQEDIATAAHAPDRNYNIINILDQRVVNLTSFAPAYTASKCALWSMTQSMAMAFAPHVRVNAIGPGLILPLADEPPEVFAIRAGSKPLGHGGRSEDITAAVDFLIRARSVTGQLLLIDGGEHLAPPR